MEIRNRVFVVSGGASGLGLACADALIQQGGFVVLADINEAAGASAQAKLGDRAMFVCTNVSKEEDVVQAIEQGRQHFGAIHGLLNCAGIGPAERVLGKNGIHSLYNFQRVVETNLVGTFNFIRLAASAMAENEPDSGGERGIIINTASVAAFDGQIGQAAYAASKGGIVAMTLPIARELARFGIRVMTIAPGIFETPMLQNLPDEAKNSLGQQVPFPSRLGQPDEFAALALHIIENTMLNGETIRLDGALRMGPK